MGATRNPIANSVTTGGTAQTIFNKQNGRAWLFIQNTSAGDLWVDFGATAVQAAPSIKIPSGQAAEFIESSDGGGFVPTDFISIIGATTAQTFSAKEGLV